MKGSHWFIIFIVAFLVIMFAVEYHLPKKFVWTPTFGHYDDQPFGCAVFDSLLSASLPNGYTLSKKTFYQLEEEDTLYSRGILAVAHDMALTDIDVKSLLKMAERGNKVMLASTMFSRYLKDTLNFESYRFYFSPLALKKYATSLLAKDSLCWVGDSAVYSPRTFYFYPQLCSSYFWGDSLPGKELARKALHVNEYRYEVEVDSVSTESEQDTLRYVPVAMTCPVGKGEVILVSTPLIFTNYGILDGNNSAYIFRLLSQMGEFPVVRTEGYVKETAETQQSPFLYLLSRQPLRWALYLTMIAILLFMIFTVRRRQRVIPVSYTHLDVYKRQAMTCPVGKGEVILVSTPLIFTNYGILDGNNSAYIFRLLSQMGEFPVVRTEGYVKETAETQQSPFLYLLSRQPLRWALYLTMIAILLFMIFTVRRRQRVIPVIREPENKSLEFTELIGTLYYQKKDHADLVHKKFIYFAEELRREIQVDIEEVADDERSFRRIAQKTGMDAEEIGTFVREVRPVIYGGRVISAEQMKLYIDKMSEIINHI